MQKVSFPLPDHIDQYQALNRWHQQVVEVNEAVPVTTSTRTLSDGRVLTIVRKPKAISANAKATGTRIVKQYVREYLRTVRMLGLPTATAEGMPGLYTNCVEIAAMRGCSDRTARTHIRQLQKVGLVTNYKFHGSKHDFELWINPDILWAPQLQEALVKSAALADAAADDRVDKPVEMPLNTPTGDPLKPRVISEIVKNFPHKVTVNHSNYEMENNKKDCVEKHGDQITATPNSSSDPAQEAPSEGILKHGDPETRAGGARAANVENPTASPKTPNNGQGMGSKLRERLQGTSTTSEKGGDRSKNERTQAQKLAILEGYVRSFWGYAAKTIYGARKFESWEEPYILQAIRRGVYRDFQVDITEKEWDKYQGELYRQIDMAAKYFQSNPNKWAPDPFARRVPGTGYFDAENLRGFGQTRKWLRDNQKVYRRDYVLTRINAAVQNLHKHRAGTAPKAIQERTYLNAYRYLEGQMAKYGQNAVDRFNEIAATITEKPNQHPRSDEFRTSSRS